MGYGTLGIVFVKVMQHPGIIASGVRSIDSTKGMCHVVPDGSAHPELEFHYEKAPSCMALQKATQSYYSI
jgi:hypothetical protein